MATAPDENQNILDALVQLHGTSTSPRAPPLANGVSFTAPIVLVDERPKGKRQRTEGETSKPKAKRPIGRPRKDGLPPGSMKDKGLSNIASGNFINMTWDDPGPSSVAGESSSTRSTPLVTMHNIDPKLRGDEWVRLLRESEELFLHSLISALSTLWDRPPVIGPKVESAFRSHLMSLAPNESAPGVPTLYSVMKTFWLPSSPIYFYLTSASTNRVPSDQRFIYWDPQPLLFNGLSCPKCTSPLANKGRIKSGPMVVHDLGKPFYIIGCEYACTNNSCKSSSGNYSSRYASTDASILRSLPETLRKEFPAHLVKGVKPSTTGDGNLGPFTNAWSWKALGVSTELWNMVRGCVVAGLGRDEILRVLKAVREGPAELPKEPARDDGDIDGQHEVEAGSNPPQTGSEQETTTGASFAVWNANPESPTPLALPDATAPNMESPEGESLFTPPPGPFDANGALTASSFAFNPYEPSASTDVAVVNEPSSSATPFTVSFTDDSNLLKRTIQDVMRAAAAVAHGTDSASTKRIRHCRKCGFQDCKGKGGRVHCHNPCQDCGTRECPGRDIKTPEKRCDNSSDY